MLNGTLDLFYTCFVSCLEALLLYPTSLRSSWLLLVVRFVFSSLLTLSYKYTDIATGLVFNIIFARMFLGTGITKYDWIGTMMIVVGCTIVSLFGNKIPDAGKTISNYEIAC